MPNNINHILAFIQRKSKSRHVIEKIIARENTNDEIYNSTRYYSYQSFIKNKLSIHVNIKTLLKVLEHEDSGFSIFSVEEENFYNKVTRMVILYYLRQIAPLVTLNSKKLRNTSKQDHLKSQRFLLNYIIKSFEKSQKSIDSTIES